MTGALQSTLGKTYSPPVNAKPLTLPAAMVVAILDGRKTQVRLPFTEQPSGSVCLLNHLSRTHIAKFSPLVAGDVLWVRETWGWTPPSHIGPAQILYKATEETWKDNPFVKWQSPAVMPVEFARLFLKITDVLVQRIQEITTEEALAEGVNRANSSSNIMVMERMEAQWNRYNGVQYEWACNPWVWAYEFNIVPSGHEELEAHIGASN